MSSVSTLGARLKSSGILFLLYVAIGVSISALIILQSLSEQRRQNREMVVHTYEILQQTEKLLSFLKDAETGQRGFLLIGERSYLAPFTSATTNIKKTLRNLSTLTQDNPAQQKRLRQVSGLVQAKINELTETINLRISSGPEAALVIVRSGKGKLAMDQIRETVRQLEATEKELLGQRNLNLERVVVFTNWVLWISTLFGITIIVLAIRTIRKDIKNRLRLFTSLEQNNRLLLFDKGTQEQVVDEVKAVSNLIENITHATTFIQEVGARKYDAPYAGLTDQNQALNRDNLAGALLNMREQMKKVATEEWMRNWATEGQAKFGEILRKNNENINALSHDIIANVVKYLKANQGGLFLLNEDKEQQPYLELVACYAFDRKKFIEKRIAIGEGLVGQAFQEQDIIYLTDIPKDYINITSGLGQANPTSLLIVPLAVNEQIHGVIEIASFRTFESHEIDFVKKIAESIAATIASVKMNEQTRSLLEVSQQQAEEMRAAEEEMRQNMEELEATQEEVQRKSAEMETQAMAIDSALATIEFNLEGTVMRANEKFLTLMGYQLGEIQGKHHRMFVDKTYADSEAYVQFWQHLKTGNAQVGEFKRLTKAGGEVWLNASYTPAYDSNGNLFKIIKFAQDITRQVQLQQESQQQAEEMQAAEEGMRQNMVEMQAQAEKMHQNMKELEATQKALSRREKEQQETK